MHQLGHNNKLKTVFSFFTLFQGAEVLNWLVKTCVILRVPCKSIAMETPNHIYVSTQLLPQEPCAPLVGGTLKITVYSSTVKHENYHWMFWWLSFWFAWKFQFLGRSV